MKFAAVVLAFSVSALTATGSACAAEARQDFELVNKTGYEISHVYVSPSKSDDWEEDVLGKDILDNGDFWAINSSARLRPAIGI